MFLRVFQEFLGGVITLQNYENAKLIKTEMLMTSKEFKTERYQRKSNIIKKNKILYIYIVFKEE